MIRKGLQIIASMLIAGCSNSAAKELVVKFHQYEQEFEQLHAMSKEDAPKNDCFVVGPDRIGKYATVNGAWADMTDRSRSVELATALNLTGLSRQRYNLYLTKLRTLTAEKVVYCNYRKPGPEFSIFMSSTGFCDRAVSWSSSIPTPEDVEAFQRSGGNLELVPINDGWFVEVRCS